MEDSLIVRLRHISVFLHRDTIPVSPVLLTGRDDLVKVTLVAAVTVCERESVVDLPSKGVATQDALGDDGA